MAKKQSRPNVGPDHPLIDAGFIHENDIFVPFGFTWNTWVRSYRTQIPGRTLPSGRWIHRDDLVQWWKSNTQTGSEVVR